MLKARILKFIMQQLPESVIELLTPAIPDAPADDI
jgi:hypothetical protein